MAEEDKGPTEKKPEESSHPKGEATSQGGSDYGDEEPEGPPEKEADPGAPMWVTTFADLMSLLMCFFVMLLSMATIDVEKFKAMAEGLAKGLAKRLAKIFRPLVSSGNGEFPTQ